MDRSRSLVQPAVCLAEEVRAAGRDRSETDGHEADDGAQDEAELDRGPVFALLGLDHGVDRGDNGHDDELRNQHPARNVRVTCGERERYATHCFPLSLGQNDTYGVTVAWTEAVAGAFGRCLPAHGHDSAHDHDRQDDADDNGEALGGVRRTSRDVPDAEGHDGRQQVRDGYATGVAGCGGCLDTGRDERRCTHGTTFTFSRVLPGLDA